MNALDVLNEYKTYIKIVGRRNGKTLDIEKAQIIIDALSRRVKAKPAKLVNSNGKTTPFCPRCCIQLEGNKTKCCSDCGQALDWSDNDV